MLTRETAAKKVKGHWLCPCRNGKKLRDCHFNQIQELREKISRKVAARSLAILKARKPTRYRSHNIKAVRAPMKERARCSHSDDREQTSGDFWETKSLHPMMIARTPTGDAGVHCQF